jgi:hypothetical protein
MPGFHGLSRRGEWAWPVGAVGGPLRWSWAWVRLGTLGGRGEWGSPLSLAQSEGNGVDPLAQSVGPCVGAGLGLGLELCVGVAEGNWLGPLARSVSPCVDAGLGLGLELCVGVAEGNGVDPLAQSVGPCVGTGLGLGSALCVGVDEGNGVGRHCRWALVGAGLGLGLERCVGGGWRTSISARLSASSWRPGMIPAPISSIMTPTTSFSRRGVQL